jgi:phage/plasmid-associated DNA primase
MLTIHPFKGTVDLDRLFPSNLIKIIKFLGFSSFNREHDYDRRYQAAKRPFMKGWQHMDKHLPDKLRNELPGIFRWAVEGRIKWQQEDLGEPEEVKAATDE